MRTIVNLSFAFLAIILTSSCRTSYSASLRSDYYNTYVGHTHNEIVRAWGAPSRQTTDGNGGTILIYENTTQNTESTYTYRGGYYTPSATTTSYTSFAQFYLNSSGVCYDVQTNHQKEWSEFSWGKTIGLITAIAFPLVLVAVAGN